MFVSGDGPAIPYTAGASSECEQIRIVILSVVRRSRTESKDPEFGGGIRDLDNFSTTTVENPMKSVEVFIEA